MNYTLLRNATAVLTYGGRTILIDPMLDDAGARPPVQNTPNPLANPLVELPKGWKSLVSPVDLVLVTHLHQDHFDVSAVNALDKRGPMLCQPDDVSRLTAHGFLNLLPVEASVTLGAMRVQRTRAQHGTGDIALAMAPVSGFLLSAPGEPILYIAGDTIWYPPVAEVLRNDRPEVVIVNAGGARFLEGDPIVMTVEDVAAVARTAPDARVVVVHLEAINHCLERRADYRNRLPELECDLERVSIPEDGESLTFIV